MAGAKITIDIFTDPSVAGLAAVLHAECFAAPWDEAAFRSALTIPGTFLQILSRDGSPAAFALYRHMFDEAEILTLGTLPAARGQGLGRTLLDDSFARLKAMQVERLFLEVGADNAAAQRLYISAGFKEISRRPGYYFHDNRAEDAIIMLKLLH